MTTPTVFVSYAHENADHDQWVRELAYDLRHNAVEASLDAWDLIPGQETTYFMESQIRNSEFVILICTPRYAEKSNIPRGGVGYEKNIISAEMLQASDLRPKFIPVLRNGTFENALPTLGLQEIFSMRSALVMVLTTPAVGGVYQMNGMRQPGDSRGLRGVARSPGRQLFPGECSILYNLNLAFISQLTRKDFGAEQNALRCGLVISAIQ